MFRLETFGLSRFSLTTLSLAHKQQCSTFLPQDRVASFAALSAADLLKETQKAAGDRHLTQWHTTLIEEKKLEKEHRTVSALLFFRSPISLFESSCV